MSDPVTGFVSAETRFARPTSSSVHVWFVSVPEHAALVPDLHTLLDRDERAAAERFHFAPDTHRYVVAHGVLRLLLGRYLEEPAAALRFQIGVFGKPRLQAVAPIYFNLSHSGDYVMLGVSMTGEIGVDIEQERDMADIELIARMVFSSSELSALDGTPAPERISAFYAGWARKESYIKATGDGMSAALADFSVPLVPLDGPVRVVSHGDRGRAEAWFVRDVPAVTGYASALSHGPAVQEVAVHHLWRTMTSALIDASIRGGDASTRSEGT